MSNPGFERKLIVCAGAGQVHQMQATRYLSGRATTNSLCSRARAPERRRRSIHHVSFTLFIHAFTCPCRTI